MEKGEVMGENWNGKMGVARPPDFDGGGGLDDHGGRAKIHGDRGYDTPDDSWRRR